MFEDLIQERPRRSKDGCWNCKYATTAFVALYCNLQRKHKSPNEGKDCEDFEVKVKNDAI
jgi:hypothetical protein